MYDKSDFYTSFRAISPIYYDVYQYVRTKSNDLDEKCLAMRSLLFEGTFDLKRHYEDACRCCETQMNIALESWLCERLRIMSELRVLEWDQAKSELQNRRQIEEPLMNSLVRFQGIVSLLKYIYIDIQTPLLMNNAVLNKVFFQEKIEHVLGSIASATQRSYLDLLTVLDNATSNRYVQFADEDEKATADSGYFDLNKQLRGSSLEQELDILVDQFSSQKQSERRFNHTFIHWSPMTIDIRDTIGCYLECFGLSARSDLDCVPFYTLLPTIEGEYLPALYKRL